MKFAHTQQNITQVGACLKFKCSSLFLKRDKIREFWRHYAHGELLLAPLAIARGNKSIDLRQTTPNTLAFTSIAMKLINNSYR